MLRSLLVPLDGSTLSETSLPLATRVAERTGARLHLAHVHVAYEPEQLLGNTPFLYEGLDLDEYDARHREQEQEYVASLVHRLEESVGTVQAGILEGRPIAERLADHARAVDADIVFITSHGYSGFSRTWLGSVADEMIRNSSVPLLVSRPSLERKGPDTIGHMLVPLDGSDLAEKVLPPAVELAKATGARMTLAHVISMRTIFGPRIAPYVQDTLEPDLDSAQTYLDSVADALREEGVPVATLATRGDAPATSIAALAKELEADIIAMATHGYGGVRRALLGSVADKLLRETQLPVLITRPARAA
jgi:nucleotide-binding universal stress UspA family protein